MHRFFRLNAWLFLGLIFCASIFFSFKKHSSTSDSIKSDAQQPNQQSLRQVVQSVPIAADVNLAGEHVPIERFDVKERLDRELMVNAYWHSNTIQNIKLAHRFFPVMERILAEEGVPDDFKYLAVAESDLRNKTSYAGAKGYWQFMKTAGKEMGLEINGEVDERYHIEKATRAACGYLKKLKNKFGSWTKAAAAYNTGPTRLKRFLEQQKADSYYDLNLGEETSRYVFRILAFKYILSNPEMYGFYIPDSEKYKPLDAYYVVDVDKTIPNLGTYAATFGISYRTLKIYNPWLIDTKLTVVKNRYTIKIPNPS